MANSSLTAYKFQEWLDSYREGGTRSLYRTGVKQFLKLVYGGGDPAEQAGRYCKEAKAGRDWFKDLVDFINSMGDRPPKTVHTYFGATKAFLSYCCGIDISQVQMRQLHGRMPKGRRARTIERDFGKDELRQILAHLDAKGKAFVLFLASSGMRQGEALQLKLGDVDLKRDPARVTVPGRITKSGDSHHTFLTGEAKEALQEWLKVREGWLDSSINKNAGIREKRGWEGGKGAKSAEDDRVFPFLSTTANRIFENAVKKAGLYSEDSSTGRNQTHLHMLRKFFLSQAKLAIPETVAEAFAGHSGYLDDSYRRYGIQQLEALYKKAEPELTVYGATNSGTIIALKAEFGDSMERVVQKNADLENRLAAMAASQAELREALTEMEADNQELRRRLEVRVEALEKLVQETRSLRMAELRREGQR